MFFICNEQPRRTKSAMTVRRRWYVKGYDGWCNELFLQSTETRRIMSPATEEPYQENGMFSSEGREGNLPDPDRYAAAGKKTPARRHR
jgi:hypothetical protein